MTKPVPVPAAIIREELCSNCIVDFDEGYWSGREVVGTEASPKHSSIVVPTQSTIISGRTTPVHDMQGSLFIFYFYKFITYMWALRGVWYAATQVGMQGSSFPNTKRTKILASTTRTCVNRRCLRNEATKRQHFLLPFSAHHSDTLKANIKKLAEGSQNYDLLDLSFTLSGRRSLLAKRAFAIAKQSSLDIDLEENSVIFGDAKDTQQPRAAFVFTGMLQVHFLC